MNMVKMALSKALFDRILASTFVFVNLRWTGQPVPVGLLGETIFCVHRVMYSSLGDARNEVFGTLA